MEKLLEPAKLKEIFKGVDTLGGLQQYADRIQLLHHRYLEVRLMATDFQQSINLEELYRFIEDADYLATQYTNPLVIEASAAIPIEEIPSRQVVQDALTLAGTIYEFLADIAEESGYETEIESPPLTSSGLFNGEISEDESEESGNISEVIGRSELLHIKSALCYGLGMYESRIQVILSRMLKKLSKPKERLKLDNLNRWADYLLLSLLSRRLKGTDLALVQHLFHNATAQIRIELRQAIGAGLNVQTRYISETEAFLSLIDSILNSAEAFEFGDEAKFQQSLQTLGKSINSAYSLGNYELVWIYRTLSRVISIMWEDSPWQRLKGIINHDLYLQNLVNDGVVTLWTSQIAALELQSQLGELEGGYLDDRLKRVIIHMPTSAGKTLLAELAIAKQVFENQENQCVYIAPTKALCDQIANHLSQRLSAFGVGVTSIVSDNEINDYESFLLRKTNVIVITPEKLTHLFRQKSASVHSAKLFIFDELQTISKGDRGWIFEEIISLLLQHPKTKQAKMLFLSAVMPNHLAVQEWVDPEKLSDTINEPWQPTRVLKGVIRFTSELSRAHNGENILYGNLSYVRQKSELISPLKIDNFISSTQFLEPELKKTKSGRTFPSHKRDATKSDSDETHAVTATARFARLGPVLVYCPKKEKAAKFCHIACEMGIDTNFPNLLAENEEDFTGLIEFLEDRLPRSHPLILAVKNRVAYHHSGLPKDVRNEIENAFKKGLIHVMAATSTLIEGVNFPVKTLLLSDYCTHKYYKSGKWHTTNELSMGDFKNASGRAGRALYETEGQVIFMQSIVNYPLSPYKMPFDEKFQDYLGVDSDSRQLDIRSAFQEYVDKGILELLSQMVEQVDNGTLSAEQLLFDEIASEKDHTVSIIRSLQSFSLLLSDQGMTADDEESYVRIFQGTFFGKSYPEQINTISTFCHRSKNAINAQIPHEYQNLFAQTGLKIPTCRELLSRTIEFWSQRTQLEEMLELPINESLLVEIADVVYNLNDRDLAPTHVTASREGTGSKKELDVTDGKTFFKEWIVKHDVNTLMNSGLNFIKDDSWRAEQFVSYTQQTLGYRIPWLLSSFWLFSKAVLERNHSLELTGTILGRELLLLPSYSKFGVNTPAAALFSTLGINPATLARQLGDLYENEAVEDYVDKFNYPQMVEWLQGIDINALEANKKIVPHAYIRRLSNLLSGIRPLEKSVFSKTRWETRFYIAGWGYYAGEDNTDKLPVGSTVILKRDESNKHDRNAVQIFSSEELFLGYVPRSLSKDIAYRVDRVGRLEAVIDEINIDAPAYKRVRIRCFEAKR